MSRRGSHSITVRVPDDVRETIGETARRAGSDMPTIAAEMLTEAARMRRLPGIVFADGVRDRVAQVAGTGLDVWEVVERYRAVDQDWDRLRQEFDWLADQQLQAAL